MARFTVYYKFLSFNSSAVWIKAPDEEVSSGGGVGLNALTLEGSQNMQVGIYRVYHNFNGEVSASFYIRGDFYVFVKVFLYDHPSAHINAIDVKIYDNKCNQWLSEYKLTSSGISECNDCEFKVSLKKYNKYYHLLEQATVNDGYKEAGSWFNLNVTPIHFARCRNSDVLTFALTMVIISSLGILGILLALLGTFQAFVESARGCGRTIQGILIRQYLQNLAAVTGVTIHDSNFLDVTSPLYNATIVFAPTSKGWYHTTNPKPIIVENLINYNGVQFLNYLCDFFNLKWVLVGSDLYLKNVFEPFSATPLYQIGETSDTCCQWGGVVPPKFGWYEQTNDGYDIESQHAGIIFNDIIDFSNGATAAQTEALKRDFSPFANQNFRNSGLSEDGTTALECVFAAQLAPVSGLQNADNFLLTQEFTVANPRIVVWDGVSPTTKGKAVMINYTAAEKAYLLTDRGVDVDGNTNCKSPKLYNMPIIMDDYFSTITGGNHYTRWNKFYRDSPQNHKLLNRQCEATISGCSCSVLDKFGIFGDNLKIGFFVIYRGKIYEINKISVELGGSSGDVLKVGFWDVP